MTYFNQIKSTNAHEVPIPFARKALPVGIASILFTTAALSLLTPTPVSAQDSAATATAAQNQSAATNENNLEEVHVTGIRFSQRSALDRKKSAGTMMDSLVAEDIGAFPDKNIGEALQRIPGIQLNRDNGEGSTVSIRGVDPDLLRVEVNNVGAMGMAGSRGVDFRDMASELVKSLDVIKGSEARLTEGGIGGTIQVNTRKPNEFKENFLSVAGEAQYNDLIGDVMPKINLTGVYKPTDRLGVLVNVTASDKTTVIHALRNTQWARFADYDNSPEKTVVDPAYESVTDIADCVDVACSDQWLDFSPYLPRYGIWQRDEKRLSANTTVEYQFTDNLSGHINYTYNERDKTAHDLNLQIESNSAARIDPDSVLVSDMHNVTYFETINATISNRTLDFAWNQESTMFETGFDYKNGGFEVIGLFARSTTDQDIDSKDTHVVAAGVAGIKVQLNDSGLPDINLNDAYLRNAADLTDTSNKFDVNNPASYNNRSRFKYAPSVDEAEENMGKLDFTFRPESSFFTILRGGVQQTTQSFANNNFEYNIIRDVGVDYNGSIWTIDDQVDLITGNLRQSPELFKGYSLPVGSIKNYMAVSTNGFIEDIRAISNDNTTRDDLNAKVGNYDVEVDTNAIYLQANFETEIGNFPLFGNFGVRYVETDTAANGDVRIRVMVDQLDENGDPAIDPLTGSYLSPIETTDDPDVYNGRKTVKSDYSDLLPSLNVTLGLIPEELELYFGASKVMARPRITDINVNATCTIYKNIQAQIDNTANYCTGGNPDLEPYRATQMDLALTWYPNEDSIVSAVLFTKDLSSWIIDPDLNYGVDFFDDGRQWDVKQKLNGSGVNIKGVELQASTAFTMLPAPWDGLGMSANYTYMEAEDVGLFNSLTGEELPFPSQSKDSYNLTVYYEADVWSVRAAYNYRSEYLATAADLSGNPAFVDEAGYLDAKFSYDITPQLRFHIDGRNLTGEVQSINAGPGRISTYDWAGREYSIGITYKM